jgi:Flp pilus assembly protein TadD
MALWKPRLWRAAKRMPGDSEAWYAIGVAASDAGRNDEATYALVHSVELAPDHPERAVEAARQLARIDRHAEVEKLCRRALASAGDDSDLRAGLVRALLESGRDTAAHEALGPAVAADPNHPELRSLAAEACERLGELSAAILHLEAALSTDPDHPELNRRLAALLVRTGERGRAITCWRRVTAQDGQDDLQSLTALGIELSRDGQHPEALEVLEQVVARAPGDASAHANLGMALLTAGDLEGAVTACREALELDAQSAQAHCGLGLAYQKLGRLAEAAQAFAATERLAPDNPAGPLNLALVLDAQGQREEARLALLRAAGLAPEDREIHDALAQFMEAYEAAGVTVPQAAPLDASIRGELRSFQLFDVLEFLRIQSKTGSLMVSSRHGAGVVRLVAGALTSASAPGTPRLGDVLVHHGVVTRGQIAAALEKQRAGEDDTAETLGSILLQDRLIDRAGLANIVFEQALTALEQMTGWTEGAFSFHPSEGTDAPPISFSIQQIVLELMRLRDEANQGGSVQELKKLGGRP